MYDITVPTAHQQVCAVALAIGLFVFVIEMVRQRRLSEDFSWFWILASFALVAVMVWPTLLQAITYATGAKMPATAVFMLGILFLTAVQIHLSSQLTRARREIRRLAQRIAILTAATAGTDDAGVRGSSTKQ